MRLMSKSSYLGQWSLQCDMHQRRNKHQLQLMRSPRYQSIGNLKLRKQYNPMRLMQSLHRWTNHTTQHNKNDFLDYNRLKVVLLSQK